MSPLPTPWTWTFHEHSREGTHATVRLPADLGAAHMAGHYPGHPILPAVLIMDWVQQAATRLNGASLHLHHLHRARFVRPLHPADNLNLTLDLRPGQPPSTQIHAHAQIMRCEDQCEDQLAAELDATFTPVPAHA
ncbi:hypothetical protein CP975_00375 [Streptomyces alboniger]|uniref:ApeI dehydratase-like domain-containing protein n=2 Tax=Streptomyces alboniger TaxID=132473 RepID=A0A5J6HC87_STRAD|nr:hypothetical protein CP975_00375 [Streptomyces alboniger]